MASEITEMFDAFGPQLNTFMSVGILLQYFRRKLLQFEWSNTVSNLVMCRFISLTKLCSAVSFARAPHYSTLSFTYCMLKINSFSKTQQKTSWIYLDIALFQDFKVSLLLPHACEDFARVYLDRKVKNNNNNCKFEFRLNCKQRLMFYQGPISDNKVYFCRCCSVLFVR